MATKSEARRASLLDALRSADAPVSGGQLASTLSVSRQIIVQDIALLREAGANIVATTKGYVLADAAQTTTQNAAQTMAQNAAEPPTAALDEPARTFKLHHEVEQTREELQTIIALGGHVHNVSISHRAYGRITAPLEIANQADIERFINDIESGKSSPLSTATSGYHYHLVSAPSNQALEAIGRALADKGFLAPLLPHEQEA
ncbi:transcription repressor NadR [uncultured Senegalimassilia sp.]|mgnify:CR=1 FL=1|uniref:transcription repressor NadR n=1 Tax=uncultured Senegalimassilia sp. TaxID=1714350 RepID=UPI0027DB74B0|nr:transcription repressor NadR [uncultured Senegalimassilia sp.]